MTIETENVAQSSDDATRFFSSSFSTTQNWCRFGNDGTNGYDYGARFQNIDIPNGATINSAKLSIMNRLTETKIIDIDIYADNTDDAATFSTHADFIGRSLTTALVTWLPSSSWTSATRYEITGLENIVQEIINRAGWSTGNSIAFLLFGQGTSGQYIQIGSYDVSSSDVFQLEIDYTSGGITKRLRYYSGSGVYGEI